MTSTFDLAQLFNSAFPFSSPATLNEASLVAAEEASTLAVPDMVKLHENIKFLGLRPRSYIHPDGNCQFASLACQLFGQPELAPKLRKSVVSFLRGASELELANGSKLKDFITEDFSTYVNKMSQYGAWGDQLTLQTAAHIFETPIAVISSATKTITLIRGFDRTQEETQTIISPTELRDLVAQTLTSQGSEKRVAILAHLHELHYLSLEPDDNYFDV